MTGSINESLTSLYAVCTTQVRFRYMYGCIAAFSDRFPTNLQDGAQCCLKKFKDSVLFLKILLRDRASFQKLASRTTDLESKLENN